MRPFEAREQAEGVFPGQCDAVLDLQKPLVVDTLSQQKAKAGIDWVHIAVQAGIPASIAVMYGGLQMYLTKDAQAHVTPSRLIEIVLNFPPAQDGQCLVINQDGTTSTQPCSVSYNYNIIVANADREHLYTVIGCFLILVAGGF